MLKLVISDDEGKTTTIPLTRDELTIGRKDGNSIRLTERNVSRRHARIVKRTEGFFLEDLASYNGIVINGQRLAEARPMRNGDQILIGDYKLQVVEEAGAQISAPPPPAPPPPAAEHAAPLIAATTPPSAAPGAPGLAALNDPLAPSSAARTEVPESIRGMRLVFLSPAGVPAPVMLDRLPMILGRSETADIALAFSSISREHARLVCDDNKLYIEDLGSSNGVQINGEKINRRGELGPGDMVQLGVVEFRVARRGDSTVVIQRAASDDRATAGRSNKGLILGVIFGGVSLGLAVLLVASKSNNRVPVTAPALPAVVAPAAPPAPTPVAIAPAAPAPAPVAAPAPAPAPEPPPVAAPEPPPTVAAAPPAPEPPPTPPPAAVVPAAAPEPVAAAPVQQVVDPADRRHPDHTADRHPRAAAPAPAPRAAPTPAPAAASAPPPDGATPMDQARACLRNNSNNMAAGNQCVVQVLRGHATTTQELGLLCTTYRSLGRTPDAMRCMRNYIQHFPEGPQVGPFQTYIDNNQ